MEGWNCSVTWFLPLSVLTKVQSGMDHSLHRPLLRKDTGETGLGSGHNREMFIEVNVCQVLGSVFRMHKRFHYGSPGCRHQHLRVGAELAERYRSVITNLAAEIIQVLSREKDERETIRNRGKQD